MSKETEADKNARAVTDGETDRQTENLNEQCCSVQSIFNPAALLYKTNTNHLQKRTEQQTLSYASP